MRATHGVSTQPPCALGSTGNRQDPGRVFKNKKMAGHMGDRQRTQQNLEIVRTDVERGLIFVKGSVPGAKGSWLMVSDAVKVAAARGHPVPGAILEDKATPHAEEAPAGMVDHAAEHEVHEQVAPEQQEELLHEQHAGAGDETTPAVGEENKRS